MSEISSVSLKNTRSDLISSKEVAPYFFIKQRLKSKGSGWLRKAYFEALYRKDGYFEFSDENGRFFARIIDVHSDGRLILQAEAGDERAYYFKEVSFVQ